MSGLTMAVACLATPVTYRASPRPSRRGRRAGGERRDPAARNGPSQIRYDRSGTGRGLPWRTILLVRAWTIGGSFIDAKNGLRHFFRPLVGRRPTPFVLGRRPPKCCTPFFVFQAAIAGLHARAPRFEDTDRAEVGQLYAALENLQPSPVVSLNRPVAVAKLRRPEEALAMIDALAKDLRGYFYFFGVPGALLLDSGRPDDARDAFDHALVLAKSPADAAHIRMQIDRLMRRKDAAGWRLGWRPHARKNASRSVLMT
jgi:hypothetical protein